MELVQKIVPAETRYSANGGYDIPAGKTITIESAPGGTEMLSEEVPAGKSWRVVINVSVVETDE